MPAITIPQELYDRLGALSTSFNDTPANVIERLLNEKKENPMTLKNKTTQNNKLPARKLITMKEIRAVYPVAKEVHAGNKKIEDAVEYLVKEVGMNENSAKIYIKFFVKLKEGNLHRNKMTAKSIAVIYFLNKIHADDGIDGLKTALDSLRKHIQYRINEGLTNRGYPNVYADFSAKLK